MKKSLQANAVGNKAETASVLVPSYKAETAGELVHSYNRAETAGVLVHSYCAVIYNCMVQRKRATHGF